MLSNKQQTQQSLAVEIFRMLIVLPAYHKKRHITRIFR